MKEVPIIVGIDLGTTNSLVAISDKAASPRILKDGDSSLIPSVVSFDEFGKPQAVGHRAKTLKAMDAKRVIYSVKRLMGLGRKDLLELSKDLPFDFSPSTEEMIKVKVGECVYTPIDISSEILKRCRFVAENALGFPIRRAVVTVPAYFNDAQRAATILAGKLAGLEVIRVLNEPTAAALAFGFGKKGHHSKVAVYDFGGGTFDISILKITDGIFEVLSTDGNTRLGGDDLDFAIFKWMCSKASQIPETEEEQVAVRSLVERLKIALTDAEEVDISMEWNNQTQWSGVVTRKEVEAIMRPVVQKTIECCERALKASALSFDELDEVILVGGSTRIPLVREMVQDFFGKTPNISLHPEEAVALGASIQASILAGDIPDTLLLDVVPLSLGIETLGGVVSKIIPRNTTLPCSASEKFTTSVDGQTGVDVHVLQGERELVRDCRSLGRLKLKVPPLGAGVPKILVTFLMDANGMLKVTATDEKGGEQAGLEVRPSFGLTDAEVEKMLQEAWGQAESDFRTRQLIEARNQAEALIRATEKSLNFSYLPKVDRDEYCGQIAPVLKALKEDLKTPVAEVIAARSKELELLTRELAEKVLTLSLKVRLENQPLKDAAQNIYS